MRYIQNLFNKSESSASIAKPRPLARYELNSQYSEDVINEGQDQTDYSSSFIQKNTKEANSSEHLKEFNEGSQLGDPENEINKSYKLKQISNLEKPPSFRQNGFESPEIPMDMPGTDAEEDNRYRSNVLNMPFMEKGFDEQYKNSSLSSKNKGSITSGLLSQTISTPKEKYNSTSNEEITKNNYFNAPSIKISIGRVEVRGVIGKAGNSSKRDDKSRTKTKPKPQLTLEEYIKLKKKPR